MSSSAEASDEEMQDRTDPRSGTRNQRPNGTTAPNGVNVEAQYGEDGADAESSGAENDVEYDPDQKTEEKRRLRAQYRQLLGKQNEERTDISSLSVAKILENQRKADKYFRHVKAPQEATLDSKVMLQNAEMGAAIARSMRHDVEAFDMDDYIAKLVTFMGGRRGPAVDSTGDEVGESQDMLAEDDDGSTLDWDKIGQRAYSFTRKAPTSDFMVGPLSIQIKERKKTVRARLKKDARDEVQPAQLGAEDIQRSENETTKMVKIVHDALLKADENGINLFEFFINPKSFAQSVENLFYVSFLVRDGKAAVHLADETEPDSLLMISPSLPPDEDDETREAKKQQVFTLTADTWRDATKAFQIRRAMYIPHRERPREYDGEIKDDKFLA